MGIPTQAEYFDFVAGKIGRWAPPGDGVFTLAAARFVPPGEARTILVLVCGEPWQWARDTDDRKHAAIEALIQAARLRLSEAISGWENEADGATGDVVLAFQLRPGCLNQIDPPAGRWGEHHATRTLAPFPRPDDPPAPLS